MIKSFIEAWNINAPKLLEWFAKTPQTEYSEYAAIWRAVIEKVINPYMGYFKELDASKTVTIDFGNYQGTLLFITPLDHYQPNEHECVITCVDYGSCSGCDTLLGISGYDDEKLPDEQQLHDYMVLALNLLQRAKPVYEPLWLEGPCD